MLSKAAFFSCASLTYSSSTLLLCFLRHRVSQLLRDRETDVSKQKIQPVILTNAWGEKFTTPKIIS